MINVEAVQYVVLAVQVLIGLGTVAAALLLRHYLPAYIAKKGENVATKEDIGEITDRLERVRTGYLAQIEELKASLQGNLQVQQGFRTERDMALLRFYDAAIVFMYNSLAVNFGEFPMDGGRALFEHDQQFRQRVTELLLLYQRLVLYFDHDDELRSLAEQTLLHGLNARKVHKKHYSGIKLTQVEEDSAFQSGDRPRIDAAVKASNEANGTYWSAMRPIVESFRASMQGYLTVLNKHLRPNDTVRKASEFLGAF